MVPTTYESSRYHKCDIYTIGLAQIELWLAACCKWEWNYLITKCSFFNVNLLGNSVRASKAFPVGFFCAVQLSHEWTVALSKKTQLGRPCKPVLNVPVRLRISHVPPPAIAATPVPNRNTPTRPSLLVSMRPPPTQGCSGIPFHAPHVWGTHGLA